MYLTLVNFFFPLLMKELLSEMQTVNLEIFCVMEVLSNLKNINHKNIITM